MGFGMQVAVLFILAIPIACIAWTVTHEELFREPREYCVARSRSGRTILERKFFYLFTCEYCFSHYVTLGFLILTRYHLWLQDWRGYIISGFALVFVANVYMSAFGELRLEIRQDRQEIATKEELAEIRRRRAGLPPDAHLPVGRTADLESPTAAVRKSSVARWIRRQEVCEWRVLDWLWRPH